MKDFNAIFKTYSGKIKTRIGLKTYYAKKFIAGDPLYEYEDQFHRMFFSKPLCVKDFMDFFSSKKEIKTVLEVGCSVGMFPRILPKLFKNIQYTGMDISAKSIEICKKHIESEFICQDFIKFESRKKYDFVYSFDVIDHVYDINSFISNIIKNTKKYAYVNAYRGFHPELKKHKTTYRDNEGIYMNDVSVDEIKNIILKNGLSEDEFNIRDQLKREKVLYDGDLKRAWERCDENEKMKLKKLTGYNNEFFEKLPTGLDFSSKAIQNSLNKITPESLGMPSSYYNIDLKSLVIEIFKK